MTGRERLAFLGGTVLTADARGTVASGVLVEGGVITAVGTREEILPLLTPDTRVIDLTGKTLVRAFTQMNPCA